MVVIGLQLRDKDALSRDMKELNFSEIVRYFDCWLGGWQTEIVESLPVEVKSDVSGFMVRQV